MSGWTRMPVALTAGSNKACLMASTKAAVCCSTGSSADQIVADMFCAVAAGSKLSGLERVVAKYADAYKKLPSAVALSADRMYRYSLINVLGKKGKGKDHATGRFNIEA